MSKPDISLFRVAKNCIIGNLPFTPEQREVFEEVLMEDKDEIPDAHIIRILKNEWGIAATRSPLAIHRRKECLCFRDLPTPEGK